MFLLFPGEGRDPARAKPLGTSAFLDPGLRRGTSKSEMCASHSPEYREVRALPQSTPQMRPSLREIVALRQPLRPSARSFEINDEKEPVPASKADLKFTNYTVAKISL